MAKKGGIVKYTGFASLLFSVAAICMIFLTAIVYKVSEEADPTNYTGLQVIFGFTETQVSIGNMKYETEWFKFSFMNLLPYILIAAGLVLTLLKILGGSRSKLLSIICAACFVAGGILAFFTVNFAIVGSEQLTDLPLLDKEYMSLGIGSVLCGVFAIIAGAAKAMEFVFD